MSERTQPQRKAVALLSGGLDSMLAAKCIQSQGIHVEGLNFFTGFCVEGHTHALRSRDRKRKKRNNALWVAEQLGIRLHFIDIVEEYKEIVLNPRHGYGAHLNPCLDCKIFMLHKAKDWMEAQGYDFIITGEVIGQRPKSQRKHLMPLVAKQSGVADRLLRPLSAKCLPLTLPEREGWVDREKLFDFTGRSRKPQMALAEQYHFTDYAQPAGGCCFLTDETYSAKLLDLWQSRGERHYELDDVMLLKVGRHLRPAPHWKIIIGREEGENHYLQGYRNQFDWMAPAHHVGPLMLLEGHMQSEEYEVAARVLGRYSDCPPGTSFTALLTTREGQKQSLEVVPFLPEEIPEAWKIDKKRLIPSKVVCSN